MDKKKCSIKVFIRIRPLLPHENGQEVIISPDADMKVLLGM
jgi:hypothetical protein